MANVKLNPILEQLSGKVGKLVFRRFGQRTIVGRTPSRDGQEPTEAQKAHRERFRRAVAYGKAVMADPEALAPYEEAAGKPDAAPLFSLLTADYLNEPTVEEIDLEGYTGAVGDEIVVLAHDDFEVVGVELILTDDGGEEIEHGAAVAGSDGRWIYTATAAVDPGTTVHVSAVAWDRPSGVGAAEAEKAL